MNKRIVKCIESNLPGYFKNSFDQLLRWKDVERLLNLRPFINPSRFESVNKREKMLQWPTRDWLSDKTCYPPDVIQDVVKNNTCLLYDCSRVSKKINSICNELEKITGRSADAHIYFTVNKNNPSFNIHNDISDNLIVQVYGESNIKVWNETSNTKYRQSSEISTSLNDTPTIDVTLKPGDAIYVPKFYWHQVIALTKRMSVSFPISATSNKQERYWISIDKIEKK